MLKKLFLSIGMEPVLFFHMFAAFIKSPVFQTLLYEKACINRYGEDYDCKNISKNSDDKTLQSDANHLYLISSLCIIAPSIFSSLLLGSLSDSKHAKLSMMIPFIGLIMGDLNYLVQTIKVNSNPYYLLISDIIFGFCGGYTAILGTLLSYNVKITPPESRSLRVAAFEGVSSIGITVGYALSGVIHERVGYGYCFMIIMAMHACSYFYIVIFGKELEAGTTTPQNLLTRFQGVFHFLKSYRHHPAFIPIAFILISLAFEMIVYAGTSDILYSYLRYKLAWNDKSFGWYNGIGSALNSCTVLFLYPLLYDRYRTSNLMLSVFGIFTKIVINLMYAFLFASWYAYLTIIPMAFGSFVITGLRASSSHLVGIDEQGKLFSLIALIEGVASIMATSIFNGLYPLTLNFFAGTIFCVVAVSLLLPIGLLINAQKRINSLRSELTSLQPSEA